MKQWLSANEDFLFSFLANLDTPISLAVWLQVKHREWDSLALRWCDPQHYPEGVFSALRYAKDVQATDLLRKAPLPTTFNRRDAAIAAWEKAEMQCYHTNERIGRLFGPWVLEPRDETFRQFLLACRKRMTRWLGKLPDKLEGGFGPGTCVEYKGADPTVVDKIWLTPTTTPSCADIFDWHYSQTLWGRERWANRLGSPGLSRGNRLTTVPKDGKVDRPISIEPLGNLWLQLGIGRHLKSRLELIGLPAYRPVSQELFPGYSFKGIDAQSIHRDLLFRCQAEFATIDLSSASDTVATELVRAVCPPDWFQLLDDCRSKLTSVPSEGGPRWRYLEKFSSMGNGFTFELESLVFTCLLSVAFGLTPGVDLWVFGDDIILPKHLFEKACNLLTQCGFVPNRRKSFASGPFYESCGGNVHSGIEVTPLRITGPVEDPPAIFAFHNALFRRGASRKVLRLVRNKLPRKLQLPGPSRLGDVVLHGLPFVWREIHSIRWVRVLRMCPREEIPLERWSAELAMVALLLGSSCRVVRRRSALVPSVGLASVS
ncbi:RNA-directed RNA polymerase, partial [ssRNA phage Gephyllon.1_11]